MSNLSEEAVVKAILNSGGIITVIANRLNCGWNEAETFINSNSITKIVYESERQSVVDLCESVVLRNVQLAQEAQRNGEIGDSTDAKWILSRLGKDRGYAERQEVTGRNGAAIELNSAMLISAMRTGAYRIDEEQKSSPQESQFLDIS